MYIPGFDPQPVAANELGVGADGETTWLLAPGVSSGTLDGPDIFGPGNCEGIIWRLLSVLNACVSR